MTNKIKFIGLKKVEMITITNGDLVADTQTYALGDGMWSIEVTDHKGCLLAEFVGPNGTRPDGEADDLWAKYDEWFKRLHHRVQLWESPDGTKGSFSWFLREAERGNLHSLLVTV